mgnify:FL=1
MDWEACQAQWEAGLSSKRLAKLYPVTRQAIDAMADKGEWQRATKGAIRAVSKLPVPAGLETMLEHIQSTPETIGLILKSFELGNSQNAVAAMNELSSATLSGWRKDYPAFERAVRKAQSKHTGLMVNKIRGASSRDWRAADRLLQVHELTRSEHLPQGVATGKGQVNVVININRPAIEGQPGDNAKVIEHE